MFGQVAIKENDNDISKDVDGGQVINIAVVACGDRVKETLVLLKSALMFTETYLHFIIITENELQKDFVKQVSTLILIVKINNYRINLNALLGKPGLNFKKCI